MLTVACLLAACGGSGPTLGAAPESVAAMARAKPAATMRATYTVTGSRKVVVKLASNAKVTVVRFRRHGVTRTVTERLSRGRGRVVLRPGAASIRARAKATGKLARSPWVKARKVVTRNPAPEPRDPQPDPSRPPPVSSIRQALTVAARQRVFFGHQSVGRNILEGIPTVYEAHDVTAPDIVAAPAPPDLPGGYVSETEIGENTEPLSKISDFDDMLRGGIASRVDVALMKLCYVDVTEDTDVRALFTTYHSTVARLAADYPDLILVHVTTPLTTDDREDNAARERLNQLMRNAYGRTGRLFDLAKVESTKPDGTRVGGSIDGTRYFALYGGYASDSGHLNDEGAERAATQLLRVIAGAAGA